MTDRHGHMDRPKAICPRNQNKIRSQNRIIYSVLVKLHMPIVIRNENMIKNKPEFYKEMPKEGLARDNVKEN